MSDIPLHNVVRVDAHAQPRHNGTLAWLNHAILSYSIGYSVWARVFTWVHIDTLYLIRLCVYALDAYAIRLDNNVSCVSIYVDIGWDGRRMTHRRTP